MTHEETTFDDLGSVAFGSSNETRVTRMLVGGKTFVSLARDGETLALLTADQARALAVLLMAAATGDEAEKVYERWRKNR